MIIEKRIAQVADRINELPEGGDHAQELYAIISALRDDMEHARWQAYQKYQNALVKWLEFHNEVVECERGGQDAAVAKERTRIIRAVIGSADWRGGYEKLTKLIDVGHD